MNKTEKYLLDAGFRPNIKGFDFLVESIELVKYNKQYLRKITKDLYPKIAEMFEETPNKVERAIRHSIAVSGILKTNAEFIAYAALVLKEGE